MHFNPAEITNSAPSPLGNPDSYLVILFPPLDRSEIKLFFWEYECAGPLGKIRWPLGKVPEDLAGKYLVLNRHASRGFLL